MRTTAISDLVGETLEQDFEELFREHHPQTRQFSTPIPKALEEQLGLHLERVKVPAEFVVVDHIEHPTEN